MGRLLVVAGIIGAVLWTGLWAATRSDGLTRVRIADPHGGPQFHPTMPYSSIDDVMLGMKRSSVNRLMRGRGQQIRKPNGHVDVWYSGAQIEVWFDHGIAKNVSTSSVSYRLFPSNLGVNSTHAAILRAYRVHCFQNVGIPMPCVTATRIIAGLPRNMTFWLKSGRAVSFDVGVATWKP